MPVPPAILNKIKLLIKLTSSPNPHESETARTLADNLISKYNLSPEDLKALEDPKPLYGEDDKLFSTMGLVGWKSQLALAIGSHFDCQIVQEELVPSEGEHQYNYYVYGDPEDSNNVKFAWQVLSIKVDELIIMNCSTHDNDYTSSYSEGVVEAMKSNIKFENIVIPQTKSRIPQEIKKDSLSPAESKKEKPKPANQSVDVNSQSIIKDIAAYYNGLYDGQYIYLQDLIESSAEKLLQLEVSNKIRATEHTTDDFPID